MADLVALLDASVIIPASLNDTLLTAAESGLYDVRWSEEILEEARRNLVAHGLASADGAKRRIAAMRNAFPLAAVSGYEHLLSLMTNHPKDRHVLAAALTGGASLLVTANLRHFPASALSSYNVRALSPDEFLTRLDDDFGNAMTRVIERQAAKLHQPPMTLSEVLDNLELHAPQFVARLRDRR